METPTEDPDEVIAIEGKVVPGPASPILLLLIVLLSFPVVVPVAKSMVPARVVVAAVVDPNIVVFVIVLLLASPINLIVEVPAVVAVEVLDIVNEFPPELSPLIVTLSAPFRLINGVPAVGAPEIILAPLGFIVSVVHTPAFKLFVPDSVETFAVIVITILEPV